VQRSNSESPRFRSNVQSCLTFIACIFWETETMCAMINLHDLVMRYWLYAQWFYVVDECWYFLNVSMHNLRKTHRWKQNESRYILQQLVVYVCSSYCFHHCSQQQQRYGCTDSYLCIDNVFWLLFLSVIQSFHWYIWLNLNFKHTWANYI